MDAKTIWLYIVVMAGVTYLIRMLPLALLRKKLRSRFIKSFLFYVPYAVLAVMTVPAIFEASCCCCSFPTPYTPPQTKTRNRPAQAASSAWLNRQAAMDACF